MNRREAIEFTLSSLVATTLPTRANAQDAYPSRPIRLVVPFAPGGLVDVVARKWAEQMRKHLGAIYIDNQGGGGGILGATQVAKAAPDGYTLLMGNTSTQILNPLTMTKISYDAQTAFQPASMLCIATPTIVINPQVPASNLKDFISYAKANPGKLSYGSAGAGTITNLTGELFKHLTNNADIVHVPYKGVGAGMSDIVSGHIPMMIAQLNDQVLALHREGRIRILAVTSTERLEGAPDLPTAVEAGVEGMVAQVFNAILAPASTPADILDRLASATRMALADSDFSEHLVKSGLQPMKETTAREAQAYIRREFDRFSPIIKAIGFTSG